MNAYYSFIYTSIAIQQALCRSIIRLYGVSDDRAL